MSGSSSNQNDGVQKSCVVSGKVFVVTVVGLIVLALGLGLGLGLGLKDNNDAGVQNDDMTWMTRSVSLPSTLWPQYSDGDLSGVYGGFSPADIPGGLSYDTMI